ncbi:MAG: NADH-quinone oxidoreductase subunit L [Balneolales bacterium]
MELQLYIQLALITLALPFAGFLILIFTGKRLPRNGDWLATGLISLAFLLSLFILIAKLVWHHNETITSSLNWITLNDLMGPSSIEFGITVDNLSAILLVVVTMISMLVHFFSIGYMKGDIRYSRYFACLGLFSFSMLGIVLTNNLLLMYIFWELVGISSYLLIGHWYEKKTATNAASKAFVVNRVGDAGMFVGIMILFTSFSTFTFETIFDAISNGELPFESTGWLTAAGILIFCGAIGKSAQFPLHVWLPDAMEGPTPVSALIHAATMVAAGVYLVARVFPLLTADALLVIAYIGAVTSVIAATIAATQMDIKKVLAYSTISQLGFMIMALGVGAYAAGFMHLVTHAAFKAGLFLAAGSIIFAMHKALHKTNDHHTDAQDIRNMGGLKRKMPVTYWTFLIFTLAISGIPFTSGFLSKDEILAGTLAFGIMSGHYLLPVAAFLVAGLTAFYMFRALILTFHGEHANATRLEGVEESPKVMIIPLIILASLSVYIFYSFNPFGAASGWIFQAIERPLSIVPVAMQPISNLLFHNVVSMVHSIAMGLSILFAFSGIIFALLVYKWKKIDADRLANSMGMLYKGAFHKWYFDKVYYKVFVDGILGFVKGLHKFDDKVIDGFVNSTAGVAIHLSNISKWIDEHIVNELVTLTAWIAGYAGEQLGRLQTGKVQTYLAFMVFGFIVLFILFI